MAEGREVQWLDISEHQAGQRLDNFLHARLKGAPRALIYRIVRRGEVRVNGSRAKADRRLVAGDRVRVPPLRLSPEEAAQEVSDNLKNLLAGSVLSESRDWLVINKPSGLAVHGGSGVKIGLIEALRQVREDLDFVELVHRLDRDTSGVLLLAKSRDALLSLNNAMRGRQMDKRYMALVEGHWSPRRDYVSAPLERYEAGNGERRVRVDPAGKRARTRFALLEDFAETSLVEAEPITGRTHQIRVHAAHLGHALLSDIKYGSARGEHLARTVGLERLFLHASALTFPDPRSGRSITLRAPLDDTLTGVLERLRQAQ